MSWYKEMAGGTCEMRHSVTTMAQYLTAVRTEPEVLAYSTWPLSLCVCLVRAPWTPSHPTGSFPLLHH